MIAIGSLVSIILDAKMSSGNNNADLEFTQYTESALTDKLKKELASVNLDNNDYFNKIKKHKTIRDPKHYRYDYDLELDFSIDTEDQKSIEDKIYDNRLYYYKAYHFLKLGLFQKKDAPIFKVKLDHISSDMIYNLIRLDEYDRNFVLKQAVSRIFEDINFDLYHDSISNNLKVKYVE